MKTSASPCPQINPPSLVSAVPCLHVWLQWGDTQLLALTHTHFSFASGTASMNHSDFLVPEFTNRFSRSHENSSCGSNHTFAMFWHFFFLMSNATKIRGSQVWKERASFFVLLWLHFHPHKMTQTSQSLQLRHEGYLIVSPAYSCDSQPGVE